MTNKLTNSALLMLIFLFVFSASNLNSQHILDIDASNVSRELKSGHLKMGNPGLPGHELIVNNQYITIGRKPVVPVMGEIHFSRIPKEQWEDEILKMKANGINIISFYMIWIHHEEIEGQFDWSGNKDVRSFIKLCMKHGMLVYPRLGPWAHGEVRNGGTPDWILEKKYIVDRSNNPVYQSYVERYFKQIAGQMTGFMYKDGGPVIGIQLENEYWRGKSGEPHILWLKSLAQKCGFDVPLYTVTGWGDASVPEDEVIPLWGDYPGAPWNSDIEKITRNSAFEFSYNKNDESVGSDRKKTSDQKVHGVNNYPFLTCELGVGNQISQHRRPVFSRFDGPTIATAKLGSGSNLTGYYVFGGGSNPHGILTSMEENREETGYWVSYPRISYDFQAAIKETGELAPSYYQMKKIHYFLNEFGEILAPTAPVIAKINDPLKDMQYAVRVKDNYGFLFGINYYRGVNKPEQKDIQFKIKLRSETLTFPSKPVNIPDSCTFIWPMNFKMDDILLKYATSQPLCRIDQKERTDWFFVQNFGIQPELSFDATTLKSIETKSGTIVKSNNQYIVSDLIPGIGNYIKIEDNKGMIHHIVVLSFKESDEVWYFNSKGKKDLFLSDADLYMNLNHLHVYSRRNTMNVTALSDNTSFQDVNIIPEKTGDYRSYEFSVPAKTINAEIIRLNPLDGSERLKCSVKSVTADNQMFNKSFIKEFSLDNPSAIKNARLILNTDISCKIEINNRWLNQDVQQGKTNILDITGYLQKGKNLIMLDYPFTDGEKSFAAKIKVEYFNSDQVTIMSDKSWATVEQYYIPSYLTELRGLTQPETVTGKVDDKTESDLSYEYALKVPTDYLSGLNQLYLNIDYNGDKGELRFGHNLIADNFNNYTPWQMSLKQLGDIIEGEQLKIELFPFTPGFKIYFDRKLTKDEAEKTFIRKIGFIPEYSTDMTINN